MTGAIGGYSFSLSLPIILENSLGFSEELSFILTTPPTLFGVLVAGFISWLADKTQLRGPYVFIQAILAIVGFCMIGFLHSPYPKYVGRFHYDAYSNILLKINLGAFLGQAGTNGFVLTSLAWQANNIRGDAKRSVSTAIIVGMSGVGGIYSSLVFRQQVRFLRHDFMDSKRPETNLGCTKVYSRNHSCVGAFCRYPFSGAIDIMGLVSSKQTSRCWEKGFRRLGEI